jgi:hypothetical protein
MFNEVALDIFGKADRRICMEDYDNLTDEENAHMEVTLAYAFAYSGVTIVPSIKDDIANLMDNVLGLPYANLDLPDPQPSTPWGLAKLTVDEMSEFAESDGWNAAGAIGTGFNRMPYGDFSFEDRQGNTYEPYHVQESGKVKKQKRDKVKKQERDTGSSSSDTSQEGCKTAPDPWNWAPLLESNGFGYFTRQEHVMPHIGFTGRLYGIEPADYMAKEAPVPNYNFCEETDFVLDNTNTLATSDEQKIQVEFFDSKFTSLLPTQIGWSLRSGFSEFEFWYYDMALVIGMYDATMLVWREKVKFNTVRPPTVVEELKGETTTQTYAGPFQGSQQVKGTDWQPYIRTMPHAEYPSGSACICTTYAEIIQLLSGSDAVLGGPLEQTFAAGSSFIEPGATPASTLTLTFPSWSSIQEQCGASREHGGMHFSEAVPGGNALCTGVADFVVDRAKLLRAGDASGAMVDFDDREILIKQ